MAYLGHKPAVGENNSFRILDDISSFVLTFDGSSASAVGLSDETITITENNHRFITGQRVTYSNGGGGNITGLVNGQAYFVINHSKTQIKLASSASNALAGTAVNLTGLGTGSSHTLTLAFDGVNTKFDPTFGNGMHDTLIKRAAQLVISINGVIQQPHDTATPTTGFGVDSLGHIIFSTAPVSTDIFWGHILASNTVTFDSSDNDVDTFTGNGSTTSFTLSKTPPDNRNILVTIDGVVQYPSDAANTRSYNVSENVMTFTAAPGLGTVIQVRHIGYAGVSGGGGGGVTGFYGRTGNVSLQSTDNIVANNATFSGNVSIAQTLTYEDVTDIDAIGLITARSGINVSGGDVVIANDLDLNGNLDVAGISTFDSAFFPNNKKLKFGNTAASPYTEIVHSPSDNYTDIVAIGGTIRVAAEHISLTRKTAAGTQQFIFCDGDNSGAGIGNVNLYQNGDRKFRTLGNGAQVESATGDTYLNVKAEEDSATANAVFLSRVTNSSASSYLMFGDADDSDVGRIRYNHSDNSMNFRTNAVDNRIFVKSDGNVGIGTDDPNTELEVFDDAFSNITIHSARTSGNIGGLDFRKGGVATGIQTAQYFVNTNGEHFFHSQGSQRLKIASDGDLLITGNDNAELKLKAGTTNGNDVIAFLNSSGTTKGNIFYDTDNNFMVFKTDGTASSNERLRITSGGKVGLNQNSPYADVDITSSVEDVDNGTLSAHGIRLSHVGATDEEVIPITAVFLNNQDRARAGIGFISKVSGSSEGYAGAIGFYTRNTADGNGLYRTDERLRINSDGKVGIGTDNPSQPLTLHRSSAGQSEFGLRLQFVNTNGPTQTSSALLVGSYGLKLKNYNSNRNFLFETGKVGIGTDNPSKTLTIFGASSSSFRISKSGVLAYDHTFDGSTYTIANNNGSAGIPIIIGTKTAGGESVRINSDGKVGIATDTGSGLINTRHGGTNQQVLHIRADLGSSNGRSLNLYTPDTDNAEAPFRFQTGNGYVFQCDSEDVFTIAHDRRVGIGQSNPQRKLHVGKSGTAEANIRIQGGADYGEIRVKDSDNALTFHHNVGGAGSRELFSANGSTGHFSINCYTYQALTITTNENGTNGPEVQLMHNSASPAANDIVGQLRYSGKDSAGNTTLYGKIETKVDDPTNGQETSHIDFSTRGYSAYNTMLRLKRRGTASAPSYTADDADGIILDVYNTGNPYPRYMNFIAKSAGNTDSNIDFWTETVGGSPIDRLRIDNEGSLRTMSKGGYWQITNIHNGNGSGNWYSGSAAQRIYPNYIDNNTGYAEFYMTFHPSTSYSGYGEPTLVIRGGNYLQTTGEIAISYNGRTNSPSSGVFRALHAQYQWMIYNDGDTDAYSGMRSIDRYTQNKTSAFVDDTTHSIDYIASNDGRYGTNSEPILDQKSYIKIKLNGASGNNAIQGHTVFCKFTCYTNGDKTWAAYMYYN